MIVNVGCTVLHLKKFMFFRLNIPNKKYFGLKYKCAKLKQANK